MNLDDCLFYDVEVFKYDSFVVFKSIENKLIRVFKNNFKGLRAFVQNKMLIGFNNYGYDDKILTYMLEGKSQYLIKQLSDQIINGENVNFINKPIFKSLDCFQQADPSFPSLKKIEGNLGKMILESSVPWDLDRPLTNEEFEDVLLYCMYDVEMTISVFKERFESYFLPKFSLVEMLGKSESIKWNTTTISGNLLLDRPLPKWDSVRIPSEMWDMAPRKVVEMWEKESTVLNQIRYKTEKKVKHTKIEEFGCNVIFAYGGLHGEHKIIKRAENVKILDVSSMYPNIILLLNVLGNASVKYREILERRLKVKHVDKILSDALKLILNSVYGNLNNKFSVLYNPMATLSVCLYGQISLYQLCKYLQPFVTIININTDGVAFIPHHEGYILAYQQWEKDFSLQLEEKEFDLFIQKDVNNYITVKDGKIDTKGGDVNRYHKDAIFKNNDARILDICLVDYLLKDKPVLDSLVENLDKPYLFQYILKAGKTYQGTYDAKGNQYNKVNRVFAGKETNFCLFKKRMDDGLVKFTEAPEHMILHNDTCENIKNFEGIVDLNHYQKIVNKRIERWI